MNNEKPDRPIKFITIPTPKFKFNEILCISHRKTKMEYEKCEHCFDGKLKVFGPKGDMKEVTCEKCHGTGQTYKLVRRMSRREIAGMVRITTFRVELSDPPRDKAWGFEDGISYQGHVVWREDLDKESRNWNVFRENLLLRPEECEPLEEWTEDKRNEHGRFE